MRDTEKQKRCLWCQQILTEENTYRGGPSRYSYCKKHSQTINRSIEDFRERLEPHTIPEDIIPYKHSRHLTPKQQLQKEEEIERIRKEIEQSVATGIWPWDKH